MTTTQYRDRALPLLAALLDDPVSEHAAAVRLLVLELMLKRDHHREKIKQGLVRARARGTVLGRPKREDVVVPPSLPPGMTHRQAAVLWGCSKSTVGRRLRANPTA